MTESEVIEAIRRATHLAGGLRALASKWGFSPSYLSDLLNGRRAPSETVCDKLGIAKVVTVSYRRVRT